MRVGIEATSMLIPVKTGIQRYATSLILAIAETVPEHPDLELFLYFHSGDRHADASLLPQYVPKLSHARIRTWPFPRGYRLVLPVMAAADRLGLLHLPANGVPRFKPCRMIATFHDASWARLPEDGRMIEGEQARVPIEKTLANSDAFIAVSESTKHDLIELYHIPTNRVSVVHHGVADEFWGSADSEAIRQKYGLGRYILHVGVLQYRKNLVRLIEAYSRLKREYGIPQNLVLAGPEGWGYDDVYAAVKHFNLDDGVKFPGYIPQEDMPGLYAGADLFVFPSLYEGFGIPVLEAMACGAIVAASNISALPEVGGDAAVYFDPYDVNQIAATIYQTLTDAPLRNKLRTKGLERARRFTWDNTARKTLHLYRRICADSST